MSNMDVPHCSSRVWFKASHTVETQFVLVPSLHFPLSELLTKSLGFISGLALELNRATESEESAAEWSSFGRHGPLHDYLSM